MIKPEQPAPQPGASPQRGPRSSQLPPPEGYESFYRESYRGLTKRAMYAGATPEEAQDAVSETLEEMLQKWPVPGNPIAYARRAVVSNFIKAKTRGSQRVAQRMIERGHISHEEGIEDDGLARYEHDTWVADVLRELPRAQREVMLRIAIGLDRKEIAEALGISNDAVRARICDARRLLIKILNRNGTFKQSAPSTASPFREEGR